jgi:hypothetical protein
MPEETFIATPSESYVEVTNRWPELSPEPIDKRPMIIGIIVALIFIILFALIGWWLFAHPENAAVLRDISIIFLGLGTFFVILLLIALVVITAYLILKINDLIQLLDREIRPMLAQVQDTTRTVKGTTTFISDHAVRPVIATASAIAAIKGIFRSVFRR